MNPFNSKSVSRKTTAIQSRDANFDEILAKPKKIVLRSKSEKHKIQNTRERPQSDMEAKAFF